MVSARRGTAADGKLLITATVLPLPGYDSRETLSSDTVIGGFQQSAITTDRMTVYKFTNKDEAAAFAQDFGQGGYRSASILLAY